MENSTTNNKQKVQDSINLVNKFKNIDTNIILPNGSTLDAKYDGFSNKLTFTDAEKEKFHKALDTLDRNSDEIFVQLNISEHNTLIFKEEFKKAVNKISNTNFQFVSNIYMTEMEQAFQNNENVKNTTPQQTPSLRMKP